ncbi:sigma-70 family RNA polymerase sigma factor [Algoriphagus sp. AGSA1]|uniref:RNA polymerase sigma factor n=1 Tax=Algoriphagus sp. AGSA1 TaxID=2907213 RepID=UPI001F1E4130|nr:sigma-70 family RNA polymerase sigma factor [Algoriphagus sp. AGSA1]MCE7057863.1 sigma-70 family RNA polymerase sigma factor [Algoriphagus sp. AGSA1]
MSSQSELGGFLHKANENSHDNHNAGGLSQHSDSTIWIEFLQGSEQALATLFELYAHKLFNYGKQFTTDAGIINDAVQDVFYQLIKNKAKLGAAHSVKYYLFSCFRRRLLRLLKQHKKLVFDGDFGESGNFQLTVSPDYHGINTSLTLDQKQILENACNKLPVRQREILALYFFEGLTYVEIAEVMEFSQVKSARKLLYRALSSLGVLLEKHRDILKVLQVFMG